MDIIKLNNYTDLEWKSDNKKYIFGLSFKKNNEVFIIRKSLTNTFISFNYNELSEYIQNDVEERNLKNMYEVFYLNKMINKFNLSRDSFQNILITKVFDYKHLIQKMNILSLRHIEFIKCVPAFEKNFLNLLSNPNFHKIIDIGASLNLSFSNLRLFYKKISHLENVNKISFEDLINKDEIIQILNSKDTNKLKWQFISEFIDSVLTPNFNEYNNKFNSIKNSLNKSKITVKTDKFFESGIFTFSFDCNSLKNFEKKCNALKTNKKIVEKLFE